MVMKHETYEQSLKELYDTLKTLYYEEPRSLPLQTMADICGVKDEPTGKEYDEKRLIAQMATWQFILYFDDCHIGYLYACISKHINYFLETVDWDGIYQVMRMIYADLKQLEEYTASH